MKLFFATDIHGSAYWAQKVVDAFNKSNAEMLYLLGDVYYHGPRNPLPREYNPMEVSKVLNAVANKIVCITGNCDSQVDTLVSNFNFVCDVVLPLPKGNKLYLTHGHVFNEENLPHLSCGDMLLHGHFHTTTYNVIDGVKVFGLSSVSLPKENCPPCYAVVTDDTISIFNLQDDTVILQEKL